jgi:deoxyadenosine/deoxycytidine kinase
VVVVADIHIGVGGNIGAGKTEFIQQALKEPNMTILLKVLSEGFESIPDKFKRNLVTLIEEVPDQDVLRSYYKDANRFSYLAQTYFFDLRVDNQHKIEQTPGIVFEDRTLLEDMEVFGRTQHDMGLMTDIEWKIYSERIYKRFSRRIVQPHLWVYLEVKNVDVLMERIKKRGREVEQNIPREYIQKLNDNYERFCRLYTAPHLIINFSEDRDIRPEEFYTEKFQSIADKIREIRSGWRFDKVETELGLTKS